MKQLEEELKVLIINALDLEDIEAGDIETEAALFGEGLGLDSIDALELGIALKKKYNISFSENATENREYFASIKVLAEYIKENGK